MKLPATVTFTAAAEKIIDQLYAEYGPLILYQYWGTCFGKPMVACLTAAQFYALTTDQLLSRTDRYSYFLDSGKDQPHPFRGIITDVVPVKAYDISLESKYNVRFVPRLVGDALPEHSPASDE